MAESDFEVRIDDRELRKALKRFGPEAADGRKVFRDLFHTWKLATLRAWEMVKATGGVFRGQKWPAFASQYVRKTDGAVVPAWGGVQKVRGRGTVKGRKRPSGQRVKQSSVQLQDTKRMRGSVSRPIALTRERLVVGTNVEYAEQVSKKRDWLRWTKQDEKAFAKAVRAYWDSLISKRGFS